MTKNMQRTTLAFTVIFFFLCATSAIAQPRKNFSPSEIAARSIQAQTIFDEYKSNKSRAPITEDKLIQLLNLGLQKSNANTAFIRVLLASRLDPQERIGLVRLLAAQYDMHKPSHRNNLIIQDLKLLALSADNDLSTAATFAFTRLGFAPGFEEVIDNARKSSVLDDDAYFGEIAHALPFAPPRDQARLAKVLRESKNFYASQIVADGLNSEPLRAMWSNETKAEFGLLLEATEPKFPQALGVYDIILASDYSRWLNALAILNSSAMNKSGVEIIMSKLNDPKTEPRKVMAFLSSGFGPGLFENVGEKHRFMIMFEKISLYSKQLPMNHDMAEIVELVSNRLAEMPR